VILSQSATADGGRLAPGQPTALAAAGHGVIEPPGDSGLRSESHRSRLIPGHLEEANTMVDVPEHKVEEIRERFGRSHPEAFDGGVDPNIPAFP
jgi:hypothetical protein